MRSRELNERITLLPSATETSVFGNKIVYPDPDSSDAIRVWATVKPVKQTEAVKDSGVQTISRYTFYIRYRADLESTWRIAWRGDLFDIQGVTPNPDHSAMTIDATEHT